MKLALCYAFLAILASISLCSGQQQELSGSITKKIKNGNLDIAIKGNRVSLVVRKHVGTQVEASLYTKNGTQPSSAALTIEQDCEKLTTCIQLANRTHAKIKADPDSAIVKVSRFFEHPNGELTDCFTLADDTVWFAGPEHRLQRWPIQHMYFESEPYLTSHPQNMALAERYWLSSLGVYVYVDEADPLFLDQNNFKDNNLCLIAKNEKPYQHREQVTLSYEIGVFADPRVAHYYVVETHFGKPTDHPSATVVTLPIWSTWARHKLNVSQDLVKALAREILANDFKASHIEIDDRWETCYGSAQFDRDKFPDVANLTSDLRKMGFLVSLWTHPFINEGCDNDEHQGYDYALKKDYFVKDENGQARTSWWQGKNAAVIDFTNAQAVDWWVGRLKKIQDQLGIASFKFDAGESSWLPGDRPMLTGPPELMPGIYTRNYTSSLAEQFGNSIEVRTGWKSQRLPVLVRMIDKDTRWTWSNGLPTLITTLLQMNLNGYVFVLPDMIGGNGYVNGAFDDSRPPSKELFIRWLQASVFMPSLQYSFVPWDYDEETIKICKTFTDLHAQYAPEIIKLMKDAVLKGSPINPPIWWVDPSNIHAHLIKDEYLLGEKILVAPVIEESAIARDIYLPAGIWRDPRTEQDFAGPIEIFDYSAPLDVLPYFIKMN